ncbi:hypothetical protein GQ43DRAFT_407572 [Delitschia confertaspora ATCC 74209]|uniref:Aminoglycoside phosphotransferase domain-containing protein n=1 Tax=Delitschia confertaspora ATCC 74209 TaxID=1513339 RepID=A0A9P4JUE5_9PLEO|nr:hypothetical protein GQ43DRAFT_407572 [Delitschia confertaspora ATCC 74209]
MSPTASPTSIVSSLLTSQGLQLHSLHVLQSLWAGYGYVCHITATPFPALTLQDGTLQTYVIKLITPPPAKPDDEGHTRKILSYQVEQYFYTHLAPLMPATIPVAKCFARINEGHEDGTSTTAMMLTDLREAFPVAGEKRGVLEETQVYAALDWLSSFHGLWWGFTKDRTSLVLPPLEEGSQERSRTVWLNGGYTYLATRRKEYEALKLDLSSEWRGPLTDTVDNGASLSEMVAAVLAPSENFRGPTEEYQTLIHGDVKSENLFTTVSGNHAVFYDFQYVGLGLGVCDLAKLFTCSIPLDMVVDTRNRIPTELEMQMVEKQLLERYLTNLKEVSGKSYPWDVFVRHWETALVDWLRFQASWGFWGNTDWLEARVRWILKDEGWRKGLMEAYRSL